jgi:glycosyltransferase involved in cell wall biosynthesis
MKRQSVLVQGWRFYEHSFSIVNQWQLLELVKRPGIELYFQDLPPVSSQWVANPMLRQPEERRLLQALRPPMPGTGIDIVLRIAMPVCFDPAETGRTYVVCNADKGWLPKRTITDGRSLRESLRGRGTISLVTPSQWSRWGLIRAGAEPSRVHLVPHGVDSRVFHPGQSEEREDIRSRHNWNGRFVFLNISAMSLNKGVDLLLKAFARVAARHRDALLVLKGSDSIYPSKGWLNRRWKNQLSAEERNACSGRVVYIGWGGPFHQVADLFRAADAYVTPYRSEGFNMPALEAAASGLPLICTEGGPTDDYTTPAFARRIAARLTPCTYDEPEELIWEPNLDELTQAMFDVLENDAFRERARVLGPEHVRANWTWQHAVDKLLAAFEVG